MLALIMTRRGQDSFRGSLIPGHCLGRVVRWHWVIPNLWTFSMWRHAKWSGRDKLRFTCVNRVLGSTAILKTRAVPELTYFSASTVVVKQLFGWTSFANLLDLEWKRDKQTLTHVCMYVTRTVSATKMAATLCNIFYDVSEKRLYHDYT